MISELINSLYFTYIASEYLIAQDETLQDVGIRNSGNRSNYNKNKNKNNINVRSDANLLLRKRHTYPNNNNNNVTIIESGNDNSFNNKNKSNQTEINNLWGFIRRPRIVVISCIVVLINILDHLSGITDIVNQIIAVEQYILSHVPKVFVAAIVYLIALYIDIARNITISPSIGTFLCTLVGPVFLRILPAYPIMAVGISFIFMFVIGLWENVLHLPLEWLNAPIYYGTLYGPFAYVYVHVKRQAIVRHYYVNSGGRRLDEPDDNNNNDAAV